MFDLTVKLWDYVHKINLGSEQSQWLIYKN